MISQQIFCCSLYRLQPLSALQRQVTDFWGHQSECHHSWRAMTEIQLELLKVETTGMLLCKYCVHSVLESAAMQWTTILDNVDKINHQHHISPPHICLPCDRKTMNSQNIWVLRALWRVKPEYVYHIISFDNLEFFNLTITQPLIHKDHLESYLQRNIFFLFCFFYIYHAWWNKINI